MTTVSPLLYDGGHNKCFVRQQSLAFVVLLAVTTQLSPF